MKIKVEIEGTTPLLMHRFADEAEISTTSGTRPVHNGSSKGTPREQAERAAYRDEETGELYLPGPNIFAAIINAGRFHKLGRKQVTTGKTSLVPAGILVEDLVCSLGTKDFEVDSRRVVNQNTGGAVMGHRPRIDNWRVAFTLDVDETLFAPAFVRTLVDDAGKRIGVGAYRPERKGPFGRFVVSKWEVEKVKKAA